MSVTKLTQLQREALRRIVQDKPLHGVSERTIVSLLRRDLIRLVCRTTEEIRSLGGDITQAYTYWTVTEKGNEAYNAIFKPVGYCV
jgi:thiamine biosynthesis protein ThiC